MVIFDSYVSLPEGLLVYQRVMGKKTNGWIETSEIEVDSLETNF
jgi:hypothetical protein